jgi:hypothetical protein
MTASTAGPGRTRTVATTVLVVLTSIALTLSTVALWVRDTALDTDAFMSLVRPAFESEEVTTALAARLTDETLEVLDIETLLTEQMAAFGGAMFGGGAGLSEEALERFVEPLAASIEARVATTIDALVASEQLREFVLDAVEEAHRDVVLLVRGQDDELPSIVVANGVVSLDLRPVIGSALIELGGDLLGTFGITVDPDEPLRTLSRVASIFGVQLDPSFGRVQVMDQAELEEVQATVRALDRGVWWLVAATVVLAVVTFLVAPSWRRALRDLSIAALVAILAALLVTSWLPGRLAVYASTPEGQVALVDIADTTLGSLQRLMLVVVGAAAVPLVALLASTRPSDDRDDEPDRAVPVTV